MSTALHYPHRYSVGADEYLRMGEAGVFPPDVRMELIEGELIEMAPIGSRHAGAVKKLNRLFFQRCGDRAILSVQDPMMANSRSVPQPDIVLLRPRADDYSRSHPTPADVLLVVEVADTTLAFDVGTKVPLYARSGISEVWVVDLNDRLIRVYREPGPRGYQRTFIVTGDESVRIAALSDVQVAASEVIFSE